MRRLGNAGLACLGLFLASCAVKRAQVGLRTLLIAGILVALRCWPFSASPMSTVGHPFETPGVQEPEEMQVEPFPTNNT